MNPRKAALPPEFFLPLTPTNFVVNRCPVPQEEASQRIIIMRAGAFGDILMGTPLLSALRQAYPNAHLTWIAEHKEVQAIDTNPYIDAYLRWDGSYWKKMLRFGLFPLWLVRAQRFRKTLRQKRYDIFISFQPEEWPLLVNAIGAANTVGVFDTFRQFSNYGKTSRYRKKYLHPFAEPNLPPHRTDQYLLPLRALGLPEPTDKAMQMGFTEEDAKAAKLYLEENGVSAGQSLIVIAPMTTWPSRCWSAKRYAALADRLAAKTGCAIALLGSPKQHERDAVAEIAAMMRSKALNAAGVFSFRQSAALIARASVLISGDTGPMHVAAAVGTPYIALFGSTPSEGRAPLAGRGEALQHQVPCGPCDQKFCPNQGEEWMRCMKLITVEEVAEAVHRQLRQAPALA